MTLNQLRYFREVCDNNTNITKAAQGLHISQPALSKAIRELEDELDVQLLRRSKQHAQLTREAAARYQADAWNSCQPVVFCI